MIDEKKRWILTNISYDVNGMIYAGKPTFFESEKSAIENARKNLADDFGISVDNLEDKADESSNPYILSMNQDGRLEIYTVARIPDSIFR